MEKFLEQVAVFYESYSSHISTHEQKNLCSVYRGVAQHLFAGIINR